MSVKPEAVIYTDGSCLGNPGPGGWASIVIVGGTTQEMSGGDPSTTNNRMELLGVINGLKSLRGPHIVKIFSDSKYITDAFNKYWLKSWKKNGWKRKVAPQERGAVEGAGCPYAEAYLHIRMGQGPRREPVQ